MGPGSHVGFLISAKNKKLVYDHPMNISAKFGSNLFCGFRKKDENVKFPYDHDGSSSVKMKGNCFIDIDGIYHCL
jgi:hypothetical protein